MRMERLIAAAICMVFASPTVAAKREPSLAELFERVDPAFVEIPTIQGVIIY